MAIIGYIPVKALWWWKSIKILLYIILVMTLLALIGAIALLFPTKGEASTGNALPTNISGIVNSYLRVTNLNSGSRQFTVDNLSGSIADFQAGKKVLVYQVKGATVSTINSSSHGSITSYGNAGSYELSTVQSITGTSPYTVVLTSLSNSYTVAGMIQLVSVPHYQDANVTGQVYPLAWNATQGRGGVVAMEVSNVLTLDANITASGYGFAGGVKGGSDGSCPNNTTYTSTSTNYASKGEGATANGNNYGRGARANGGGGGNPHNAGGGGGSNMTSGGSGGKGYQPGGGCGSANAGGINGFKIDYVTNPLRAFFGGGGGAGQQNDNLASSGGAGGGLVLIRAGKITSSCSGNYGIYSNGQSASDSGGNDAAGGGGAGGSIVLDVLDYGSGCPISIRANGGDGGMVANSASHGGGGGGGIGAILEVHPTTKSNIQINSDPGTNGHDCNTPSCIATGSVPETPTTSTLTLPYIAGELTVLPIVLKTFQAEFIHGVVRLNWSTASEDNNDFFTLERSEDGHIFTPFKKIKGAGHSLHNLDYKETDKGWFPAMTYYRLKQTDYDRKYSYSKTVSVITPTEHASNLCYPNPAGDQITIAGYEGKEISFRLVDQSGHVVLDQFLGHERFVDLTVVREGVYVIEVKAGDQQWSQTLLVKR